MSNFTRKISNMSTLQNQLNTNDFLQTIYRNLVQNGKAFLAFRNDEATIYYNGNQLCNLKSSNGYEPLVYNHYLPIIRSRTLADSSIKRSYSLKQWKEETGIMGLSFNDVIKEIYDNIEKEQDPESSQASWFYRLSPLNLQNSNKLVLLDIEAEFSGTREKIDKMDLVFYHTIDKRLMFVEVKRLSDKRLYKPEESPKVVSQLKKYQNRIKKEKELINNQYNNTIEYYNALTGGNLPFITLETAPLLGLLLVEYKGKEGTTKAEVKKMVKSSGFKVYSIGDLKNATERTIAAIYKQFK